VTLDVYSPWRFGPVRLDFGVGAEWQSDDMANYYYGVLPQEARPGRPAYAPGSAVNLTAGAFVFTPVSRRLLLQSFVRYERFDSNIEASPIVDRSGAVTGFAALSYAF
jgi:outer membrane protein